MWTNNFWPFLKKIKATKDYQKKKAICIWVWPKFVLKTQKKSLNWMLEILTVFFLQPKIYIQFISLKFNKITPQAVETMSLRENQQLGFVKFNGIWPLIWYSPNHLFLTRGKD